MKRIKILIPFLVFQFGIIYAQVTISHIVGNCINKKTTASVTSCPTGVFFDYANDTLRINGTIGANCCGTHFVLVSRLVDTIVISSRDTGDLCTCSCMFCFDMKIPASTVDTIVYINGTRYNTKSSSNSIDKKVMFDNLINVYPNPFDNQLTVTTDFDIIQTIWISDIAGRIIKNIDYSNSKEILIDTEYLFSGFYFINVKTIDNNLITKTIIKN